MSYKYEVGMIVNVLVFKKKLCNHCSATDFCSECICFLSLSSARHTISARIVATNTFTKVKIVGLDEMSTDNTLLCYKVHPMFSSTEYFVHEEYIISDSKAHSISPVNGMTCLECKNGYPYAEPNFNDKLICWSCVDSLGWKYTKNNNIVLSKT